MTTPTPFFDARAGRASSQNRRRLLLITYHFPPDRSVGGLRWQKHAEIFAQHGWDVDVIAGDLGRLPDRDEQRLRQLSDNVTIYAAAEREPMLERIETLALRVKRRLRPRHPSRPSVGVSVSEANAASSRSVVRALAAWKHIAREKAWAASAAAVGESLAKTRRYDATISSGPPHMAHEAARRVAARIGAPLIIDLRDPWSALERVTEDRASPVWFANARRYERMAVRDARLVVMNTELAEEDMRARYPEAAARIITVSNGSDVEDLPAVERGTRFTIRFAGTIYLDRDPRPALRAAASVVRRLALAPDDFGVQFMGMVEEYEGQSLVDIAAQEGLEGFVEVLPPGSRRAALEFLAGGTMLLSLPQDADLCIPAKIFEYTQFDAWLLVLAAERSATARALSGSGADVVNPNDIDGIARAIEARYLEFKSGGHPSAVGADGRYGRVRQAERFLRHLDALVARDGSRTIPAPAEVGHHSTSGQSESGQA